MHEGPSHSTYQLRLLVYGSEKLQVHFKFRDLPANQRAYILNCLEHSGAEMYYKTTFSSMTSDEEKRLQFSYQKYQHLFVCP
jgi:hypothetical protein